MRLRTFRLGGLLVLATAVAGLLRGGVALGGASPPTVTGVAPTSGLTIGGTSVTIIGTNFTGATTVKFAETADSRFTVNSSSSITAISPASSTTGAVDITVTKSGDTSAVSAADVFTYYLAGAAFSDRYEYRALKGPDGRRYVRHDHRHQLHHLRWRHPRQVRYHPRRELHGQ